MDEKPNQEQETTDTSSYRAEDAKNAKVVIPSVDDIKKALGVCNLPEAPKTESIKSPSHKTIGRKHLAADIKPIPVEEMYKRSIFVDLNQGFETPVVREDSHEVVHAEIDKISESMTAEEKQAKRDQFHARPKTPVPQETAAPEPIPTDREQLMEAYMRVKDDHDPKSFLRLLQIKQQLVKCGYDFKQIEVEAKKRAEQQEAEREHRERMMKLRGEVYSDDCCCVQTVEMMWSEDLPNREGFYFAKKKSAYGNDETEVFKTAFDIGGKNPIAYSLADKNVLFRLDLDQAKEYYWCHLPLPLRIIDRNT